jgi:hypothetical protein
MTFAFPWALWGLLAIPFLIAIYFFRRRFRPRTVSALFLWQAPRIRTGGGRKLSKIESSILLLLEIIMAALLALAAAGPGCRAQINIHNVTFILDDSASMAAKLPDKKSPKEKASEKIINYLEDHKPFSCNIILSGFQPKLLAGTVNNTKDVEEALKKWTPEKPVHGFLSAFRLARQISGKNGKIIFCTDHAPPKNKSGKEDAPDNMEWLAFGSPLENIAIISAARTQKLIENKEEIFLIVNNFGKEAKEASIKCFIQDKGKRKLSEKKLNLSPGSSEKISFELNKISNGPIYLELESDKDTSKIDNKAILLPETKIKTRVMCQIKDKRLDKLVRSALLALGKKILLVQKRPNIIISDEPDDMQKLAKEFPGAWTVQFAPEALDKDKIKINIGPFVLARNNKICKGAHLRGSRWASYKDAFPTNGLIPLISSKGTYLLSEKPQPHENSPRHLYISFVPRHSNIQKTPAWPILIHNLIDARAQSFPGFQKKNFHAGEQANANFYKSKEIKLEPIGGKTEDSKKFNGGVFSFSSSIPAFFKIISDGKAEDEIAFNFLSSEESDLSDLKSGSWKGADESKGGSLKAAWRDEAWIFLLAALGFGILHAFYARRLEARL